MKTISVDDECHAKVIALQSLLRIRDSGLILYTISDTVNSAVTNELGRVGGI